MDRLRYQTLNSDHNQVDGMEDNGPSNDQNVMVHVVPEHNKSEFDKLCSMYGSTAMREYIVCIYLTSLLIIIARWNHVEDLDSFFTRIYYYHQHHGFVCIVLKQAAELMQFIFVVTFAMSLKFCVDYPVLFK